MEAHLVIRFRFLIEEGVLIALHSIEEVDLVGGKYQMQVLVSDFVHFQRHIGILKPMMLFVVLCTLIVRRDQVRIGAVEGLSVLVEVVDLQLVIIVLN